MIAKQVYAEGKDVSKSLKPAEKKEWEALQAEMAKFAPQKPSELPLAIGLTDIGREAPKVHTLAVGVYDAPMEEVQPGFLSALTSASPRIHAPADRPTTGRRSALAEWIASAENPLTARVMVNRLFQGHFGRGIVPTASDFGKSGELPTHPELLDWLASEFIRSGWSMKHMHRLLMTSSAYRQSSALNPQSLAKDPQETLFWRYRRWRLEGEAVRDACLSVSGELNPKMGGPSIFPELPEGVSTRGGWDVTKDVREQNRRSVYVFVRRNLRYPLFEAFDFPDTHEPCSRRVTTNTAPQALMLFNGSLALKRAQAMAGRLLRESDTQEGRVERAYRLAFGRAPETAERDLSLQFMKRQQSLLGKRLERKEAVALPVDAPQSLDPAEGAALVDFCHALMNTNELLYVE
jgi:hypothetical protein